MKQQQKQLINKDGLCNPENVHCDCKIVFATANALAVPLWNGGSALAF